jgi:hypothetical protein
MELKEAYHNAKQNLGRARHSIDVSLKYTRTVDVIKGIVERLISSISHGLDALLIKAKEDSKIPTLPELPRLKVIQVRELYEDNEDLQNLCNFFLLLRKIDKAPYDRAHEFRRNVTMTVFMDDDSKIEITIDIITEYYDRTQSCLEQIRKIVEGNEE